MKKIVNTWTGLLMTITLCLSLYFLFPVDLEIVGISTGIALFVYAKFMLGFNFNVGHGVFHKKQRRIRGFNIPMVSYFGFIAVIIIGFLYTIYSPEAKADFDPITINNLQYVGWSMAIGFVMSFVVWHYHTYYETFKGSEYDARVQLTGKGYSDEEVNIKVIQLRQTGFIN